MSGIFASTHDGNRFCPLLHRRLRQSSGWLRGQVAKGYVAKAAKKPDGVRRPSHSARFILRGVPSARCSSDTSRIMAMTRRTKTSRHMLMVRLFMSRRVTQAAIAPVHKVSVVAVVRGLSIPALWLPLLSQRPFILSRRPNLTQAMQPPAERSVTKGKPLDSSASPRNHRASHRSVAPCGTGRTRILFG
jgi:hypothetical protein